MYRITAGQPINGKSWELDFERGIAETGDAALANRYKKRGYSVEDIPDAVESETVLTREAPRRSRKKKEG